MPHQALMCNHPCLDRVKVPFCRCINFTVVDAKSESFVDLEDKHYRRIQFRLCGLNNILESIYQSQAFQICACLDQLDNWQVCWRCLKMEKFDVVTWHCEAAKATFPLQFKL